VPLELLAMLLYMQSIRDAPLCQTLPYLAFTPVFNILTGWLVLGEQVSLPGSGGIILVVIGAYLLNIDQARREEGLAWLEPLLAIFHRRESRRMLLVAIIYSFTSVIGKAAMLYVGPMSFGAFYFVLLGAASVVVVGVARPKGFAVLRNRVGWHLLVGGLMALMVVTHFLALNKVEAAYMLAVKRTSLLFGILYGAWLFGEEGLVKHLSAAVLMVLGVVLILMA
jgi:drug/metabolite transporter (DMT)-like permease